MKRTVAREVSPADWCCGSGAVERNCPAREESLGEDAAIRVRTKDEQADVKRRTRVPAWKSRILTRRSAERPRNACRRLCSLLSQLAEKG